VDKQQISIVFGLTSIETHNQPHSRREF